MTDTLEIPAADATETAANPVLAESWRGPVLECIHRGTAVICDSWGTVVAAWGDPERAILPRSACKMLQALPMVESGAADAAGLGSRELALACASHHGTPAHTGPVAAWLGRLGLSDDALRCGAHPPKHKPTRVRMAQAGEKPAQVHNQCSGKHAGFLTLGRHLGAGPEYVETEHPVQQAVRAAMEEICETPVRGTAVDGCSAPNFALPMRALATAMARFARAEERLDGARGRAAARLRDAMRAHPEMVACEGDPTTELMRATAGKAAIKSGAAGSFLAILPEQGLGIALKIDDGNEAASDAVMAALLVRTGLLAREAPLFGKLAEAPILNWRGIDCGRFRAADTLFD